MASLVIHLLVYLVMCSLDLNGNWFLLRFKYQSIGLIKIISPLPLAFSSKFMKITRQVSHENTILLQFATAQRPEKWMKPAEDNEFLVPVMFSLVRTFNRYADVFCLFRSKLC